MSSTEELCIKQTLDMLNSYAGSCETLSWSQIQLRELRELRLRKLLTHAKANSPWYRKILVNVNIDKFSEQHLHDLPVLTKSVLMENWDAIVTDRRLSLALVEEHVEKLKENGDTLYLLDNFHVLATSGSSGKRAIFVYDWEEWNQFYLYNVRYASRYPLIPPNADPKKKWKLAMIVISNAVYAMYAVSKTFHFDTLEQFHLPVNLPTEEIIGELNSIQPDFLVGTPTTIVRLCQQPHRQQLKINPIAITLAGEALYKPIRNLIQSTWPNVRINNAYGASEGIFAMNCAHSEQNQTMHLNDDGCIIQPVDKYELAVPKGKLPEKMYLTNLFMHTLPLIRYEFSDQLQLLEKSCECGIRHQLIAEPQGRPEYDFEYANDVFVHHLNFVTPLLIEKNIHEYQVVQTENGADIRIIKGGDIDFHRLRTTICNSLKQLGVHDPHINFSEVTGFEYSPIGKLRRFIKLNNTANSY